MGTDYTVREPRGGLAAASELTKRTVDPAALEAVQGRIDSLRAACAEGHGITVGDAVNLAVLEEMVRDPYTVAHAEDLQAGSSYNIPMGTQQTFGT